MNSWDIELIDRMRSKRAQPVSPPRAEEREYSVFVLDQSGSMADTDISPYRYAAAVEATAWFIQIRRELGAKDQYAAVVFNSYAQVLCDHATPGNAERDILRNLRRINPDGGTDIGEGLDMAGRLLPHDPGGFRQRIILLTDGHGGQPYALAKRLKNRKILIDTIGVGGAPSAVDEPCLRTIASVVDGKVRYRFITDKDQLVNHFKTIARDLVKIR